MGVAVFVAVGVGVENTPPRLTETAKYANKASTKIATSRKSINLFFISSLPIQHHQPSQADQNANDINPSELLLEDK